MLRAQQLSHILPATRIWTQHPLDAIDSDGHFREYMPNPMGDAVTVPILPIKLHEGTLKRNHDAPAAGHQGTEKTFICLR